MYFLYTTPNKKTLSVCLSVCLSFKRFLIVLYILIMRAFFYVVYLVFCEISSGLETEGSDPLLCHSLRYL